MARGRWQAAGALVALALIASACSGGGGGGGQGGGGSKEPIVIGASLPLTGDFAQPGGAAKRGYEAWVEMVNEKGGILGRPVQLSVLDDASEQNTVVADYTKLITRDKVDLLLGTFSSLLNLPASAVAEKNRMVYVEPAGGAPAMFERGFRYLFFAQQATAPHQADVFVDWVKSLPAGQRPKTAAYPTQDDPFAKPVIDTMRKALEAAGVKTVYATVYPPETTNFDTIANTIKARNPDLVAQGAVFEDGVGLVRSMIKTGFSPKTLFQTSAPSNSDQYAKGVGEANTEGVFYTVSWSPEADYPLNQDFVRRYQQKFNQVPEEDAADAFAAAQVLQAGVQAVGEINQDKIAEWLHANKVDTILGPLSWDQTGAPQSDFLLAQWQSSKSEIVLPKEVATTDNVVLPKPDWKQS
ncbi:MAG TPA: amino acid ABC transporter substrate-binding protein [Actinomycetota bacterium]|nr:amino acid ABC transporter substrate-binding protein [Actinomycetota bacterium]